MGGLDELDVEHDLDDLAEHLADQGHGRELQAEVAAAQLAGGLEAGVPGAVDEVLDSPELDGELEHTRDVTDRGAHTVDPEWAEAADEQGAWLRGVSPRWQANPAYRALLGELTAGSAEEIRIGYEVLLLADEEQRLITWQPADEASAAALARALRPARTGAEPRLRVV